MSTTGGSAASIGDMNPFSAVAVAKVLESDWATIVTVDTPPIVNAIRVVDGYLAVQAADRVDDRAERAAAGAGGTVLAVVGDYGTGKTHLVVHLLRHVRRIAGDRVRSVYLEANSGSFHAMYERFIGKLDANEIRERVKQFYAEVVADSLGDSPLTAGIVEALRRGVADPTRVVEQFALLESTLLRDLRERLRGVTENRAFATVLMLMLRPGFEDVTWAWLRGEKPGPVLVERGVTAGIDTDAAALEAMGVIAQLHRTRNRRFLLAIDELDKVFSTATDPGAAVLTAFKQLLQVFTAAGALLVLSGLPDFLDTISPDTQERIGPVVRMGMLTEAETRTLIEESQKLVLGRRELEPFTDETVRYVVHLSRGTARQVIRLLFHAFRHASLAGTAVTIPILDEVARRGEYRPRTEEDIRDEVRDVLKRNGWQCRTNHQVSADPLILVDFWIAPPHAQGAGYAVLVTGPVIDDKDVARLRQKGTAMAEVGNGERVLGTLVVVNGYLPADHATELGAVFGAMPVLYEPSSFPSKLTAALTLLTNLQVTTGADVLGVVVERVDRIHRQVATMHDHLDQVSAALEGFRTESERRWGVLDALAGRPWALHRPVTAAGVETVVEPPAQRPPDLPREVDKMFADALGAVAELDRFDALLRVAFGMGARPEVTETRTAIRTRLSNPESTQAAGIAVLLRKTIGTFRDGAEAWYRSRLAAAAEEPAPSEVDRDRLDTLCATYDAIAEYLPSFHLTELSELGAQPGMEYDPALRAEHRSRQARARDLLENLSLRVRQALLRTASGHPGEDVQIQG